MKAKFSVRGNMLLPQETGWMTNGLHSDLTTRNIICGYTLQTAFTASSGEITTKKRSWSAAATNGSKRTVRRSAAICLSIFITPQGKQKRYSCETGATIADAQRTSLHPGSALQWLSICRKVTNGMISC